MLKVLKMHRNEPSTTERYPRKRGRSSHNLILSFAGMGEKKSALDVGCGRGHLLRELELHGWKSIGIDSNESDIATCIAHGYEAVRLDVTTGNLTCLGKFDLIVLGDVLEHLPDPSSVIRGLHSLLNPGAKILVSVPNVAHISVRLQLLFGRFSYQHRGILDHTHLRFFTRRTLTELLLNSGYIVREVAKSAVPLELVWPDLVKFRVGRVILRLNDRLPSLWSGGFAYQYIVVASSKFQVDPAKT